MGAMGHRLRRGWRRAVLLHLVGALQEAQGCGYAYGDLRHLFRYSKVWRELPRLLEEAADKLRQRLLSQSG
jgi:hypothetical protein